MTAHPKPASDTQEQTTTNKPALIAYSVKLNDDTPIWTRIGAAWAHKRGPGFSIQLDALPLEGRIVLVAPSIDPRAAANDA
jgi:hypothetical protein